VGIDEIAQNLYKAHTHTSEKKQYNHKGGFMIIGKVINQRELIQIQIDKYNHLYSEAKRQGLPMPFTNNLKALIDIEVNHLEYLLKQERLHNAFAIYDKFVRFYFMSDCF
jgi:hypothetical protein